MNSIGLVLDIDDTLAETALTAVEVMKKRFGHPLTTWQILETYDQPGNVPEWQSNNAKGFLDRTMKDEDFLLNLQTVPDSQEVIEKLATDFPVQYYMTSRLAKFKNLTMDWLKKNNFPTKKIILREPANLDTTWKINLLTKNDEDNNIFIDNDSMSFNTDLRTYRGKLIWFNRFRRTTNNNIISCESWDHINNYLNNSIK
jgi:5'(3')-deoxyribonucleotidase